MKKPIRIDIIRAEKGISLPDLARRTGINRRTLEEWSQRRNVARDVYKLQKLACVLGCSIEDLIEPLDNYKQNKIKGENENEKV